MLFVEAARATCKKSVVERDAVRGRSLDHACGEKQKRGLGVLPTAAEFVLVPSHEPQHAGQRHLIISLLCGTTPQSKSVVVSTSSFSMEYCAISNDSNDAMLCETAMRAGRKEVQNGV